MRRPALQGGFALTADYEIRLFSEKEKTYESGSLA
jgi:hypothetical protein